VRTPVAASTARRLGRVVVSFGLAALLGCSPGSDVETASPAASELAPTFTLKTLAGGESVSLESLRGKTVILDFWATWCPPCEFQVPELNRFYDAHRGDSDVAVFGISIDVEGPDVISAWVSEHAVRYPILLGDEALARKYGAVGFPTLYVVAPDGTLAEQHVGLIESATLEAAVAARRAGDPL
jgi:thiol-disulfide isomerase/thioredoxin